MYVKSVEYKVHIDFLCLVLPLEYVNKDGQAQPPEEEERWSFQWT